MCVGHDGVKPSMHENLLYKRKKTNVDVKNGLMYL